MAKIFWDNLIKLEQLETNINDLALSHQEKLEIWQIIDNLLHHHLLVLILEVLPQKHHLAFLKNFNKAPYDENLLEFLAKNSNIDIKSKLQQESQTLSLELLDLFKGT